MSPEHVYIFHHIPKCGGTSMKKALGKWFRRKRDYRPAWAEEKRLERFRGRPLDLESLKPGTVVCGHFEVDGIYLHQRYPQALLDDRYGLFTFVREPFKLRLSLLRHEIHHRRLRGDEPIEELLLGRPNWLCRRFPCGRDDMDEVLDRYFFLGLTEESQTDFDRLAGILGKREIRLPWRNRGRPVDFEVDDDLQARFREVHELDYELYRRCVARRERAIRGSSVH